MIQRTREEDQVLTSPIQESVISRGHPGGASSPSTFELLTSSCRDVPVTVSTQIDRVSLGESFSSSGHSLDLLSDTSSPTDTGTNMSDPSSTVQESVTPGEPLNLCRADVGLGIW